MNCPACKQPMTALVAPPSETVYICENKQCCMNDVINPSVDPRS